jgi:hypothetical protein
MVPKVEEFSKRPARKNQTRSFATGPPPVNSLKCDSLLFRYGLADVGFPRSMLFAASNGVSFVHDGRVNVVR